MGRFCFPCGSLWGKQPGAAALAVFCRQRASFRMGAFDAGACATLPTSGKLTTSPRSSPLPPFSPLGGSAVHRASALSYSSHTVAPAVGGAIVNGRYTRSVARDCPAPGNCLAGTTFLRGACWLSAEQWIIGKLLVRLGSPAVQTLLTRRHNSPPEQILP